MRMSTALMHISLKKCGAHAADFLDKRHAQLAHAVYYSRFIFRLNCAVQRLFDSNTVNREHTDNINSVARFHLKVGS